MSKEVKRYFVDCNWLRGVNEPLEDCDVRVVLASDYDALLSERDALREALTAMLEIHGVTQSYAETHIEIPQSWVEVSDIARATLQES